MSLSFLHALAPRSHMSILSLSLILFFCMRFDTSALSISAFSNELAEALTSFFDSAAREEEKTPVFPPSSPLESRGRFCPSATRARNVFFMIHPSAHASVHAFVAEFMGVERDGETPSVPKRRGSEVFVVDYFNALKGYPRTIENSTEDGEEVDEDDETDGTVFKTRNLIPDQPHVVEPLREG